MDEEVVKIVTNGMTFSKTQAAKVVGGRGRLIRLIGEDRIRVVKPTDRQNCRWECNAWDCIKNAHL